MLVGTKQEKRHPTEVRPTGGASATVDVAMGHTAVLFRPGERLRLQMLGDESEMRLEMLQVREFP